MKIRYNSPVILTYALICTVVLIIDRMTGGVFIQNFFVAPPSFHAFSPLSYFRLVSHIFGHVNWTHLVGNFMLILLIGPILEEKYSAGAIIEMIFVTALTTGILNAIFFTTGLLGASGIVFMMILLSSFTNIRTGEIPLTFILIMILYLTGEVINAFQPDRISQFAHILGGICGGLFGFFYVKIGKR
jgi:membrane associated rhomboid family serine protease